MIVPCFTLFSKATGWGDPGAPGSALLESPADGVGATHHGNAGGAVIYAVRRGM